MIIGGVLFLVGLIVGSFLSSFLWRYQEKVTYGGRSMCPCCEHQINWYDNIPLISWFVLSGKCRYCKSQISVQYPLVELFTGILFALVGVFSAPAKVLDSAILQITNPELEITNQLLFQNILLIVILLFITGTMIAIAVYDYKTKEIPNGFNLAFVLACLFYALITSYFSGNFVEAFSLLLTTSFLAFIFFYSFVYFSKETWMGGGDAKFVIGMGLLLGPAGTFLAIMIASIVGSIYGIAGIAFSKLNPENLKLIHKTKHITQSLSHEIPFGPFLALGTFIAICFGPQIIDYYVRIVLGL